MASGGFWKEAEELQEERYQKELGEAMRLKYRRSIAPFDFEVVEALPTLLQGLSPSSAAAALAALEGGQEQSVEKEAEAERQPIRPRSRRATRISEAGTSRKDDHSLAALSMWSLNAGAISRGFTIRPEDEEKFPAFINVMMEHMWSYISEFTTKIIGDVIEPSIKSALGSYGGNFGFDLAECHLGSTPARFQDLRVNRAQQITEGGALDNLVLRGTVEWEGDISIVTRLGALPMAIRGVKLTGTLVIECVGLMSRPPFVQGIRVFFVNPPSLDLEFQGRGSSVLELRSIKRQVLEVLARQVSNKLVVPNRMGVQLDKDADYFRVLKPRPKGILMLSVTRAESLLAMDHVSQKSDPYVIFRCGAECHRSPTVHCSLNPTFNFQVRLPIASVRHQRVQIEFWDADYAKSDDFLGLLDLPVEDLLAATEHSGEAWFELASEDMVACGRGRALLAAVWCPLLLNAPAPQQSAPAPAAAGISGLAADAGWVFAGVYGAAQLPGEATGTKFWVTSSCTGLLATAATAGGSPASAAAMGALESSVSPRGEAPPRSTPQLERQAPLEKDCSAAAVETARMDRKLAILRQHGVPAEDIAKILEVDAASVLRQAPTCVLQATERHTIRWNHAFEFLIATAQRSEVRFELKCKTPGGQEKNLGMCIFQISQLLDLPHCTFVQALPVQGSDITLKVRMQLRRLGAPEALEAAAQSESTPESA